MSHPAIECVNNDLFEALNEESIAETAAKIAEVPNADHYKEEVEQAFWEFLVDEEFHEQETISYDDLDQDTKKLIGYKDTDEKTVPWWLEDFEWTVIFTGSDSLVLGPETLPEFVTRYAGDTILEKPRLDTDRGSLYSVLKHLHNVREFFTDELAIARPNDDPEGISISLSDIFTEESSRNEGRRPKTNGFKEFVNQVLSLCPPYNPTTTALLYANCGIDYKYFNAFAQNENTEISHMQTVFNSITPSKSLQNDLGSIMEFGSEFDIRLDYEQDGATLESVLYQNWTPTENYVNIIEMAKNSDQLTDEELKKDNAGRILFSPVRLDYWSKGYIQFATFEAISGSYSSDEYKERAEKIAEMLLEDVE